MANEAIDIEILEYSSVARISPLTYRGRRWFHQHVDYERDKDGAMVVQRNSVRDIVDAAKSDGLNVRIDDAS